MSNRLLYFFNSSNSTLNFNSLLQKLVKSITTASQWEGNRIFCFISCLRSNFKCFWQVFCPQETKTTVFRTAQYLTSSNVKGLLSKMWFFNVLTTKHCASSLNFFVSSMVIMSHLLSLLNKPWTPKPSSSAFTINYRRFLVIDFRSTYMNGTIGFSR